MITLNEIAYNIKNLAYGGRPSSEANISITQIKHWVHYHRAKLIAENIEKGITNDTTWYQGLYFSTRNITNTKVQEWYEAYDNALLTGSAIPAFNNAYLKNLPKSNTGTILHGDWLANSSISRDNTLHEQNWQDNTNRDQYGREIVSSGQNRGDFRNNGTASFWCPKPLQLSNQKEVRKVELTRVLHYPDDVTTDTTDEQETGYQHKSITLYHQKYNQYDEYNKFTSYDKPHYLLSRTTLNRSDGYGAHTYISFRSIQVSPNYHGGLYSSSPTHRKVYWKYRGTASMILEDPTKIDMIYPPGWSTKQEWDDHTTPYPISMAFVNDLIQRVVQIEMQVALKTMPDIITDGMDDNVKLKAQKSGAQVQR
jgi:hypothetical protein